MIAEKTAEREEKSRQQKELFQKREELSDRMSRLDKDLFRLQSQKEKLEERLENSANYMWDEYELTYSAALELKGGEEESLPEIRKHIASL